MMKPLGPAARSAETIELEHHQSVIAAELFDGADSCLMARFPPFRVKNFQHLEKHYPR
jgi:hypothetical protein